jgi:hypothetical protein
MPNNVVSNAGTVLAFNALNPLFADVSLGYAYSIILVNQTAADVVTGTFTIETADPVPGADPCVPGPWAPLQVWPDCAALPGAAAGPATITLSAQSPVKANSQCAFAAPCPGKFLRVDGPVGGTLEVIVVMTRLKHVNF